MPNRTNPPGIPSIATRAEIVGGAEDGQQVAVIDTRDAVLALVVDPEGNLSLQTRLSADSLVLALEQITAQARTRAAQIKAGQS